ncbi:MAG: pyridoxine 5'-phosphate synthase [Acidobacteriota bacterium]|nr:pyridoxine 5'-phosphate synthase [Thermoanaerobaculaceae bacterium]
MRLCVNIDHIATLREARKSFEPDPLFAAQLAELAGADGITVHLRADRRHIQDRDVSLLKEIVKTKLNVEMASTNQMVEIMASIQPHQVTLVPEKPNEVTTEGGLDVILNEAQLRQTISRLNSHNIRVSIFVDPNLEQVKTCSKIGAQAIEINTNGYATSKSEKTIKESLKLIEDCAKLGIKLNLEVLAGHALNYKNVNQIVKIGEISELNIGHSIISRAVFVGMERAVAEMKSLLG